jgi:threonine/homoserine/homoserine lactone efflux protein
LGPVNNPPKKILRRIIMKLSAPKVITFWIAVVLALLGLLAVVFSIATLLSYAFWFVVVGFIVLALGNLIKGM